jgi:hypothetical protein
MPLNERVCVAQSGHLRYRQLAEGRSLVPRPSFPALVHANFRELRQSEVRRIRLLRNCGYTRSVSLLPADEGTLEGQLRVVCSMRTSAAPLPSRAQKRSSVSFVFWDLYRITVPRLCSALHTHPRSIDCGWFSLPTTSWPAVWRFPRVLLCSISYTDFGESPFYALCE